MISFYGSRHQKSPKRKALHDKKEAQAALLALHAAAPSSLSTAGEQSQGDLHQPSRALVSLPSEAAAHMLPHGLLPRKTRETEGKRSLLDSPGHPAAQYHCCSRLQGNFGAFCQHLAPNPLGMGYPVVAVPGGQGKGPALAVKCL